ncbi:MAG: hypothetical protein Q7V58_07235 [Actinomycetota bacterium]|nr:hypothetical protein [Actinomycetota bacterium]
MSMTNQAATGGQDTPGRAGIHRFHELLIAGVVDVEALRFEWIDDKQLFIHGVQFTPAGTEELQTAFVDLMTAYRDDALAARGPSS